MTQPAFDPYLRDAAGNPIGEMAPSVAPLASFSAPPPPAPDAAPMSVTPPGWTPPPRTDGVFLRPPTEASGPAMDPNVANVRMAHAGDVIDNERARAAYGRGGAPRLDPMKIRYAERIGAGLGLGFMPKDAEADDDVRNLAKQHEAFMSTAAEVGQGVDRTQAQIAEDQHRKVDTAGENVDEIRGEGTLLQRMSPMQLVITALSQGAGAYAEVATHSNPAKDILKMQIDADIANQKQRYEAAKTSLQKEETMYGRLREAGLDAKQAWLVSMRETTEAHAAAADEIAARTNDPATKLKALELGEQMRQKTLGQSAGVRGSIDDTEKGRAAAYAKAVEASLKPSGGGAGAKPKSRVELEEERLKAEKLAKDLGAPAKDGPMEVPFLDGTARPVADPQTYRKLQEKAGATVALVRVIDELAELQSRPSLSADDYRRKEMLKEEGGRLASKTQDDSAQKADEARRWNEMVGNNVYDPTPVAALRDWGQRSVANYRDAVTSAASPSAVRIGADTLPPAIRPGAAR